MIKLKRETKIWIATFAMAIVIITTIAAVPGIFSSVNSTSGYQVAGSAGSSGQALCSDGTYYDLPCSVAGSFVAGGDLSGSLTSQNVIGIATHPLPSLSAGVLTWTGSAWIYAASTPQTCNSNGCYKIGTDGTIDEWGVSPVFTSSVNGTVAITFPHAFTSTTNLVVVASATTCNDTAGGCGTGIHPYTCTPETTNTLSTSGLSMYYDGNGSTIQTGACQWQAKGH